MNQLDEQRWNEFWKVANANAEWRAFHDAEDKQREHVQIEILDLLKRFQACEIDVDQFRAEFDKRTRKEWDVFGLKGMSGAMFLNKLVKYLPDQAELTSQLKRVLIAPQDESEAMSKLGHFANYLDENINAGNTTKGELQPARMPFLVSAIWHVQSTEEWPIWYTSGRKALTAEGLLQVTGNVSDDYFAFRRAFQAVAMALNITSWECEHLLAWRQAPKQLVPEKHIEVALPDDNDARDAADDVSITHTEVQWLLAKIGHKVGCQVWIATNDRSKIWNGQKLGDLSIEALPNLGLDEWPQKIIGLIDVVWLKGKQITAAFEVEHTTSIYSGLLRMSDLVVEVPNISIPLYLVAPKLRIEKVRQQLSRPTFRKLELHERCGFFTDEDLVTASEGMLKWASDPEAITELAEYINEAIVQ